MCSCTRMTAVPGFVDLHSDVDTRLFIEFAPCLRYLGAAWSGDGA